MPCEAERSRRYREQGYWPDLLLTDYFERAVERYPDKVAVKDERFGSITYREMQTLALKLAAALQLKGVKKGDRFLVALPNWHHVTAFVLALNYLGAVGVHLPITGGAHEFRGVVKTSGAVGIVVPAEFNNRDFVALIKPLAESIDSLEILVSVGNGAAGEGWQTFEQLLASANTERPMRDPSITASDLVSLLFTSGSSGTPKGVMHDSNTIGAMNTSVAPIYGLGPDEVILMAAPLGFSAGFVHGLRLAIFLGATLILQEAWDADRYLELLDREKATFSMTTPTLLRDVLDRPQLAGLSDRLSLRVMLCGGNFVGSDLLRRAREKLPSALTTVLWGMTEGIGTACRPGTSNEQVTQTDGQPLLGTELRIVDVDGNDTAAGEAGELLMRGPSLFLGYFKQPELDEESFLPGRWLRTGDLARIDAEGFVKITGRKKDIIIRGGANISPAEIEEALLSDPRIREIACVGIPDERLGERVCACVVPAIDAGGLKIEDLIEIAQRMGLARNKWPQRLLLMDSLPTTASGKLRRPVLQASVINSHAKQAGPSNGTIGPGPANTI
jgi:acyl-CoA synthetase (AMP-forming)/AMP-acid ligase II